MPVLINHNTGHLTGPEVTHSQRTIGGLAGYFADESARAARDQDKVVYRVEAFEPQPEGTEGAVCLATTFLEPGLVGDEYFLTRGHFHANQDRPELEVTISGCGVLVLMTRDRKPRTEEMSPGSVHHVPPGTAHRVANIGDLPLVFISYWASETGHDYAAIQREGFGVRIRCVDGKPEVVPYGR